MKKKLPRHIQIVLVFLALLCSACLAQARQIPEDWELHEIEVTESGMLQTEAGDPYIVFPEFEEQECSLSGIHIRMRFEEMPHKPFLMELFWRPSYEWFGEDRKVFFILHPNKTGDTINFVVPLTRQAGYKQIRLDLPTDLDTPFAIEQFERVPADAFPKDAVVVEPYYRLSASETRNPAIIIPFLVKTFRHGMVRMSRDPAFLTFWLLLIVALLFVHRMVRKTDSSHSRKP